ncbi:unnamed protein product [Commensalibacter communis]|uniref:Uncharacterized protein n=2 Tax=Commensalibacter communis TaxID=2972786 RepID=A0A9W4XAJ2_9PROT|nr:unnamed protein product [Commensalibacter communis]CAI3958561.1 unnamed protein product [Commensalibacter communis]CAI3958943.1 unnamed protein product [Commensalibacter communis]CAI3959254.1 unnamed protein product [Commensalibacter communis]CAI3960115.1 unnamed protein product [Commensalibacter communis]
MNKVNKMRLLNIVSATALFGAFFSLGAAHTALANVADDLNANYNKIVNDCGDDNKPAYECSGNIIRFTSASPSYHAWDPSPNALRMQAFSNMYLRKDVSVKLDFEGKLSGIIYYPNMLQPSGKDKSIVSCAFPTDGWTGGRPDGCGRIDNNKRCQDMGIYTAREWYDNFMSLTDPTLSVEDKAYRLQYQCSFDMRDGVQNTAVAFSENLKAANMNPHAFYSYNELVLKTWSMNEKQITANPERLPIQAFFYKINGNHNGLVEAQYYQQDYFNTTGLFVPIVKSNLDDPTNVSFSYKADDQLINVADQLNANYNKVVEHCGSENSPAYKCSGIMFRIIRPNINGHVWDPNPLANGKNGISFSYLRKDIHVNKFMNPGRNSGYIYYPSETNPDGINDARISCSFPTVGWSGSRIYGGCGQSTSHPLNSVDCQQQGIYTADEWYKHFNVANMVWADRFPHQCGFNVSNSGYHSADAFFQSIKAHNIAMHDLEGKGSVGSNEIVIKAPEIFQNGKIIQPDKLPLEAFFYLNPQGLTEAQAYQQDYFKTTGKIVPIVYMNVGDFSNVYFNYFTADQVVNRGADIAKELTSNYNKIIDCGGEYAPAFTCTGNTIRFTNYSRDFRVWDPSPAAVGRKGISFMYIRKDLPLDKAFKDKTSGIVYYPSQRMPIYKDVYPTRCVFPVDGYVDRRYTNGQNDACGANINYPNDSKPCQEQGIYTADAWYNHFSSIPDIDKDRLNHQCGFNLIDQQDKTSVFQAVLDGQKKLQKERGSANYNELVLTIPAYKAVNTANGISYQIEKPKVLPIEAFFYTNAVGLIEAQGYQVDYHNVAGVDVPIVKFDLDITTGQVEYSYNKTDQTDVYNQSN